MNSTEDDAMNTLEKIQTVLAYRYARRQKFNKELDKIKYGEGGKPKMAMGKKLTIFLLINFTIVELYTLYIMYYLRDISALPSLITVVVGEVIHPMEKDHYIEFICYEYENGFDVKRLNPGYEPKASFTYKGKGTIYEYCNKHGLWKKDVE